MPYLTRKNEPNIHYLLDDYTDPWRNSSFLILQHGFGRSSRLWYSWIPYLSRYYKIVRPDLRGLGQSSSDFDLEKDLTVDTFIADLVALLDSLGIESVHYCGESLGGLLGMIFAAKYPERVKTLSLVAAPVHISENSSKILACGYPSFEDALRELGSNGWADVVNSTIRFPPDTDPGLLKLFVEEIGKTKVEVLIALSRLVKKVDVTSQLSSIKAPVLGLYPSAGPLTGDEQERLLRQHIPNIKIVRLPSRHHSIQSLAPASCATHVLHFVSQYNGISCHEL